MHADDFSRAVAVAVATEPGITLVSSADPVSGLYQGRILDATQYALILTGFVYDTDDAALDRLRDIVATCKTKAREWGVIVPEDKRCGLCDGNEETCGHVSDWQPVTGGVSMWPLVVLASLLLSGCNGKGVDMPPLLQGLLVVCLGGVAVMAWLMRHTTSAEGGKPASGQSVMEAMRRSQAKRLRERRECLDLHAEDKPYRFEDAPRAEGPPPLVPLIYPADMPPQTQAELETTRQRLAWLRRTFIHH